jgi:UDP-2-acetamido-2,6-beta-L-arabino-hexul-4-ose reductase
MPEQQTIAVTGANGFLGSNLVLRLREIGHDVRAVTRETPPSEMRAAFSVASTVFHLAGVNRPDNDSEFLASNRDYTRLIAKSIAKGGRKPLIVYSSSAKAQEKSAYGESKLAGEQVLLELAAQGEAIVSIWRLPNLFGKWCRPNYNSVVATFCHNAARELPLRIDDPYTPLSLMYVDDLIDQWLAFIGRPPAESGLAEVGKAYHTTVGYLADTIQSFADRRMNGEVLEVGTGLDRALYACFIAAIPPTSASYSLQARCDARGTFVEVLKTPSSGQISYFTAKPGVTRGGHYHHSKVEKFVVAHGTARFRFRHVLSGEELEMTSSAAEPVTIETIPGWAHDVTNVGEDELVVLAWANEQFDPQRPDTHPLPL